MRRPAPWGVGAQDRGGVRAETGRSPVRKRRPRNIIVFAQANGADRERLLINDVSARILELFAELNDLGSTVIMATHDEFVLSRFCARAVWLKEERLEVAS